jgi:ArsR family metal-binding transcriptional regulator
LKAAMAASGIDRDLSFRCLRLIRDKEVPSGNVTQKLTQEFIGHQGKFINPSPVDLQTLSVLMEMETKFPGDFLPWIESRTPTASLSLMKDAVTWLKEKIIESNKPEKPKTQVLQTKSIPKHQHRRNHFHPLQRNESRLEPVDRKSVT